MIPANTSPSTNYTGNRTASVFPFFFRMLKAADLKVSVVVGTAAPVTLVQNVDYSFTYKLFPNLGGQITLVNAGQAWMYATNGTLENGCHLTIEYVPAPSQDNKFRDWGPLAPLLVEQEFDRIAMDLIALYNKINGGGSGTLPPAFPALAGNGGKIVQVKADASGMEYGVTAQSVLDAATAAAASQTAAASSATTATTKRNEAVTAASQVASDKTIIQGYKDLAYDYQVDAAEKAVDAGIARDQAVTAKNAAQVSASDADTFATDAYNFAQAAEQSAQRHEFFATIDLTFADSPFTVTAADSGKLFKVDCTGGDFVFNLPTRPAIGAAFHIGIIRKDISTNLLKLTPYGADTIDSVPGIKTITETALGRVIVPSTFSTDWQSKLFIVDLSSSAVSGAYALYAVQNVANNGTIALTSDARQLLKVQGLAGPQSANALPFSAPPQDGTEITLMGWDDAKILTIQHNDADEGCILEGDLFLKKYDTVTLVYSLTDKRYYQIARKVSP